MQKHLALVLTSEPAQGGKFQYSISLLEALAALNSESFRLSVLYFDSGWEKYIPSVNNIVIHKYSVDIYAKALRKITLQLPSGLELWRRFGPMFHPFHILLKQLKPELVFYPGNDPYVYESLFRGVVPVFDLMHRYESHFPEVSLNGTYEFRERHYTNICKYATGILVDSDIGKQHVIESYPVDPGKIIIMPYIPSKKILGGQTKVPNVRNKYVSLPEKFLFYPAQFWKHKNHAGLLRAMAKLKTGQNDIKVVFVGSPQNDYEKIVKLIKELGLENDVVILGYVSDEDVVGLYKAALGLVMPTFFGPTNIPPLEAFALGCPVCISNVYAMPEQVGDAALLFDPKNIDDIADKISMLWNSESLRKKLIEKGFAKSLDWNHTAFSQKFASIVERLTS